MAIKVITPNTTYERRIAGVQFRKGVGIFEDEALGTRIAEEFGFAIEKEKAPKKAKESK